MDLRIGDAERDAVTEALHEHFAKGRLTREELDERLGATLSARTEGDLRAVLRDLPGPVPFDAPVPNVPRELPGDLGHWGHRGYRHAMHRRHHRRHGHPPVAPVLFAVFLVAAIASGPATGLFVALQALLLLWLVGGVVALVHHRRRHALRGGR